MDDTHEHHHHSQKSLTVGAGLILRLAALSTVAAFGAHKIGDLLKPKDGSTPISGAAHKALHTGLGAGMGAATAAVTGQDITRGAASGGFGALAGTLMTEAMADQQTTEQQAQRITQMSDFMTAALAFAVGLDPVFAYTASHNANEHNALKHLDTLKALGIVKEGEEVYEGEEPQKTEGQKQYERGRQRYIEGALDHARKIRGRALSIGSYEHVVENAGARYDYHHGAMQGAAYSLEYGLKAASYIPGTTGLVAGVADAAHGYGTGKYDAMDAVQTVVTSSLGVLKAAKPLVGAAKGAAKFDQAVAHSSSAAVAPSKMPACMTKSHNPKAEVFKRGAVDDFGIDVRIQFKDGMDLRDYSRKLTTLQQRKDLVASIPHGVSDAERRALTRAHRTALVKRISSMYADNPQAKQNALDRLKRSDMDHMIDLQLGGHNIRGNLRAMDAFTNQEIGRQIARQLPKGKKTVVSLVDGK